MDLSKLSAHSCASDKGEPVLRGEGEHCLTQYGTREIRAQAEFQPRELQDAIINRYVGTLYEAGNYHEMLVACEEPWVQKIMSATLQLWRGMALLKIGRYKEAIFAFTECHEKQHEPTYGLKNGDIHTGKPWWGIAVCFEMLGKISEADKCYKMAIQTSPESEETKTAYQQFKERNPNMDTTPNVIGMDNSPQAEVDILKARCGTLEERLAEEIDKYVAKSVQLSVVLGAIIQSGNGEQQWAKQAVERMNKVQ